MGWAGHVAYMEEVRNIYKILIAELEVKRPLPKRRLEWQNIRMNLKEIRMEPVNWIHLAQDRDQMVQEDIVIHS